MANMQTRGVTAHIKALKRAAGQAVTLRRGGKVTESITAVPATVTHTVADEATGMPTKIKGTDWLFEAADLVLAGETFKPISGDRIIRTDDEQKFDVVPIAGKPAVEPYDQFGLIYTVHTKEA